jgi:hypothetical protein
MTGAVTLELPEEVARQARRVAQRTGCQMADVLTDWLIWGATSDGMQHTRSSPGARAFILPYEP